MSAALKLNPQVNIRLTVQQGPHAGQRFSFSKNKIAIGRSPENDIILVNDPLISRQHAYIEVVNNDVEIINLSQKNPILVNNEAVSRWKLTNDTVFVVGGSTFNIQIENQQSVIVTKPQPVAPAVQQPVPTVAPLSLVKAQTPAPQVVKPRQQVAAPQMQMPRPQAPRVTPFIQPTFQNLQSSPKAKMYVIIGLVLAIGLYLGLSDSSSSAKKNKKSTLKYSDEIALKLNASETVENFKRQEAVAKSKQNSSYLRAEENFTKGMRAYQLNNFASALDHFQLTLITVPDHVLAKRYAYLAKVRFDEILKAKIELGQSYFERNNFKLCRAMYQQVIDMLSPKQALQGPAKDTNLQLAQIMVKKCQFAAEGIR